MKQVCFLGAGNMGEALIKGLLSIQDKSSLFILESNSDRRNWMVSTYGITAFNMPSELIDIDVLILAVKPQQLFSALKKINPHVSKNTLIISIAAGISLKALQVYFPDNPMARVMPNTPALIQQGMSGISFSSACKKNDKDFVLKLFRQIGEVQVAPEQRINAITAMSGSGPAYVFFLLHEFATQAASIDLPYDDALDLITQTFIGASNLLKSSTASPEELISKVASKGGTTEAALKVLQASNISDIIKSTLLAAHDRAVELG